MKHPIYLDYNASTPIDPRVSNLMIHQIKSGVCGNPSSSHFYGREALEIIQTARQNVRLSIEAELDEQIVFTSGATESLNLVLKGALAVQRDSGVGNRLIISEVEHPAVYEIANSLDKTGFEVFTCKVNDEGILDVTHFTELLKRGQIGLVSLIHANAEIGSVQPIAKIVELTKSISPNTLIHTDASQSFGKIPTSVKQLKVDFLTAAGHKIYAPKGIGCLYVRDIKSLAPQIHGAGQENGLRGGTENILLIAAFGKACYLVKRYWDCNRENRESEHDDEISQDDELNRNGKEINRRLNVESVSAVEKNEETFDSQYLNGPNHFLKMKQKLLSRFQELLISIRDDASDFYCINGARQETHSVTSSILQLPNTLSISFKGLLGPQIVANCPGVAFGSGSACHSNEITKMSKVLVACGVSPDFGRGTVRLSTGRFSTAAEMLAAAELLAAAVATAFGWSRQQWKQQQVSAGAAAEYESSSRIEADKSGEEQLQLHCGCRVWSLA